jgi:hypothetical protein
MDGKAPCKRNNYQEIVMPTTDSLTYYEALQKYKYQYFAETKKTTATTRELAAWALASGRWEAPRDLLLEKCREDFAAALRDEEIKDDNGRPVRANQVARIVTNGVQQYLWGDIRNIPRKHLVSAVQVKREQMVGECRQIDRDCEFWNSRHPKDEPVQCHFDFRDDVEEGRYSGKFERPDQPR